MRDGTAASAADGVVESSGGVGDAAGRPDAGVVSGLEVADGMRLGVAAAGEDGAVRGGARRLGNKERARSAANNRPGAKSVGLCCPIAKVPRFGLGRRSVGVVAVARTAGAGYASVAVGRVARPSCVGLEVPERGGASFLAAFSAAPYVTAVVSVVASALATAVASRRRFLARITSARSVSCSEAGRTEAQRSVSGAAQGLTAPARVLAAA